MGNLIACICVGFRDPARRFPITAVQKASTARFGGIPADSRGTCACVTIEDEEFRIDVDGVVIRVEVGVELDLADFMG